jgi:hypothetical protein
MDCIVEFDETATGSCPVREFLDQLKATDPDDFAAVVAGLAKLRNRQYHREPSYSAGRLETSGTPGTGFRYESNIEPLNEVDRLTA